MLRSRMRKRILNFFKLHYQLISAVLVLLFFWGLLFLSGSFNPISNLIDDALFVSKQPNPLVSIVAIDEDSLAQLGAWPWSRSQIAEIITKIDSMGARVIALDITLFEEKEGDDTLQQAINGAESTLVLAAKLNEGKYLTSHLETENGFVNLFPEVDEKVRTVDLTNELGPSFSYITLLSYLGIEYAENLNPPAQVGFTTINANQQIINYYGNSGSINTISASTLLETEDLESLLPENSIVFIGSTVQDLKQNLDDRFFTPVGTIPGVEIHAQIVSSLLDNDLITPVADLVVISILGLLALGSIWGILYLNLRTYLILGTISFVLYALIAIVVFNFGIKLNLFYPSSFIFILTVSGVAWRYLSGKRENLKLRQAFAQYVNDDLLGKIMTDPSHLELGGRRKHMTVMFSDIRGFTSISEKIDPEELVHFLNDYLTAATQVIFDHQGAVDKYLGDAIMALWNAPVDDHQHALNSCISALAIIDVLNEFNKHTDDHIPELRIGIGVNTGDMVVGNMGSELRFDYTVMGDNVNLSSRLEGLTKQYKVSIILGEGTIKELNNTNPKHKLSIRHLDTVTVKGKLKPIKIYQLIHKGEISDAESVTKPYEDALADYLAGRFTQAQKKFSKVHKQFSDPTSKLMADRCARLNSASAEWPGYWKWDVK